MKNLNIKNTLLACAAVLVTTSPAMANDMINNQAFGYVGGSIVQEDYGFENEMTVEVGSIKAERAEDNTAEGFVQGDILQRQEGIFNELTTKVGSITATEAYNNTARGTVNGRIIQETTPFGASDVKLEALVGVIAADGLAWNNQAEGYVDGDIVQFAGDRSKLSTRVGSISK